MQIWTRVFYTLIALTACSLYAQKVYQERGGLIVMEMEDTESPLGRWVFHEVNAEGYPTGAKGTGHLEYMGPWGVPTSPLEYHFQVETAGVYYLHLRSHKRLDPGDEGDKHNDCFVHLEGDYTSGNEEEIPLGVLYQDTKLFGGADNAWGRASRLDHGQAHLKDTAYNLKAGHRYTLVISGRSNQFNIDRIVLSHETIDTPTWADLRTFTRSELTAAPTANAGSDIRTRWPVSGVTLQGTGTDEGDNGTIVSYNWTQISGPSNVTLNGQNTPNLYASNITQGRYTFSFEVTDDQGLTNSDTVHLQVHASNYSSTQLVWDEDFESAEIGATATATDTVHERLVGTDIFVASTLSGEIVSAPAGFTSANGKVVALSTGSHNAAAIRPAVNPIDLGHLGLFDGDTFKLSYDLYIPDELSVKVGNVQFRWKNETVTDTGPQTSSKSVRTAGVHHIEMVGSVPLQTRGFLPTNVRPFIRFDLDGTVASSHVYIDNLKFVIETQVTDLSPTGYEKFSLDHSLQMGEQDDEDGDGLTNLEEYALGGNPKDKNDRGFRPKLKAERINGKNTLTLEHRRRKDPASGLLYTIQSSQNLKDWNNVESIPIAESEDFEIFNQSLPASHSTTFYRIQISK